jgi:disease resistance protein RPM1
MWIAEGFVQEKQEMSSFKIGEGYFNELVNRSMIQMVDSREDGEGTVVCGCQVHDMVLDLIRSISSEENFVTVLGNNNELRGIVRRLALQYEGTLKAAVDMQLVRSFISWQWDSDKWISLSSFKVVRVLALHRNQDHLQVPVRNLPHLRYLQLRVRSFELPAQEMGCLKFLRTLDVDVTGYEKCDLEDINFVCPLTKLPSVRPLTEMLCLRIRGRVNTVPDGIGKLTSLEELEMRYGGPEREAWGRFVKELCSLRELRLLRLDVSEVEDGVVLQSLRNLQKLEVLSLTTALPPSGVADAAAWGADVCLLSRRLRQLSLTGIRFSRLPPFCCINPSRLPHLSHLSLRVVAMDEQDLRNLGGLPQLRFLHLDVHSITAEVDCNNSRTDDDGCCLFQNLIRCSIKSRVVRLLLPSQEGSSSSVSFCMLNVEASMRLGSERADSVCKAAGVAPTLMPSVQELSFLIYLKEFIEDGNQDQDRVSLAMEYFASLQDVSVSIDTNDYVYRDDADEEQVKAALRHAVDVHPNRPTLRTRGTLLTRMEWWRQRRESLR